MDRLWGHYSQLSVPGGISHGRRPQVSYGVLSEAYTYSGENDRDQRGDCHRSRRVSDPDALKFQQQQADAHNEDTASGRQFDHPRGLAGHLAQDIAEAIGGEADGPGKRKRRAPTKSPDQSGSKGKRGEAVQVLI